ncbi:hypothetical protein D3C81_2039550 [compost metagenome]
MHISQGNAHRYTFGLAPGVSVVVGQHHSTALTHRDQSLACADDSQLQAVLLPHTFPCGEIEQVGNRRPACCVGRA